MPTKEAKDFADSIYSDLAQHCEGDQKKMERFWTEVRGATAQLLWPGAAIAAVVAKKRGLIVTVNRRLALKVAKGLIAIAELAMPDTYFATDSRVKAARRLLKEIGG